MDILREHRDRSSIAMIENIIKAVNSHAGDTPQSDDITLVVAQRNCLCHYIKDTTLI